MISKPQTDKIFFGKSRGMTAFRFGSGPESLQGVKKCKILFGFMQYLSLFLRIFVTHFQLLLRTTAASEISASAPAVKPARIQFIDVLRAFAILMMLQGHFVDTTLAAEFRNPDHPVYSAWYFMRGLTAPIFFFTTGLVFVFLLLKDGRPLAENARVQKGLRRGLMLIGLGYLLKINLFGLLTGYFHAWYFTLDVLHSIGVALLLLIGFYALGRKTGVPLWILLTIAAFSAFLLDPVFKSVNYSAWPTFLANFFTVEYGSIFTPIPWVGYTLFGGLAGYVLHHRPRLAFTHAFPLFLAALGYAISYFSAAILMKLYFLTDIEIFKSLAYSNTLFWRLGHVLIVQGIFMWGIARMKTVPALWTKIGSETLTIYSVHYVVLFGTWLGFGISTFWINSLSPWVCAFGAIAFVGSFVVLIRHIEQVREFLYVTVPAQARYQWRLNRVLALRSLSRRLHARQKVRTLSFIRYFLF